MTHRSVIIVLLFICGSLVACETSKPERAAPTGPSSDSTALSESDAKRLLARAEAARDREFESRPAIEKVTRAEDLPDRPRSAKPVQDERRLLLEQLFGVEPSQELVEHSQRPFDQIARYDPDAHRVVYVDPHPEPELVETAIIARLVEALDHQHFDELPEADNWDTELALEAARSTTISFAVASDLLERHDRDVEPAQLAKRPELAASLSAFGRVLQPAAADSASDERLASRLDALVWREGWTLATALYRSSGWSAVELAQVTPPTRSADVVRPDQWMRGEPVGEWTWPADDDSEAAEDEPSGANAPGSIGPALTAVWLEEVVDPQLARTAYAGYISDAYRYFPGTEQHPGRLEWLSLWSSPDSAQQVARAFEMRLRKRFIHVEEPQSRFVVFQKGLKVGVILADMPQDEMRERARHLLDEHTVQLKPREGLPVSYVKSRQDELAEQMQAAELEERVWRDPATNLRVDLSELGDSWRVQQPDRGPVRWFARHEDGSLLQLTVELENPLGADFSSDAYRKQLTDAFSQSVADAEVQKIADIETLPERGLTVRIAGAIEEQPRVLQLWQFPTRDLIVTYSLQAPPEAFEEHRSLAASILEAAEPLEQTDQKEADADAGSGIIEYEVEEE